MSRCRRADDGRFSSDPFAAAEGGLGLFSGDNPAYIRHRQSIVDGRHSIQRLRSDGRGPSIGSMGFLDGDERIASLAAAELERAASLVDTAGMSPRTGAAQHSIWTMPTQSKRDAPFTNTRQSDDRYQQKNSLFWNRRILRTVALVVLVLFICVGHAWRLFGRLSVVLFAGDAAGGTKTLSDAPHQQRQLPGFG